MAHSDEKVFHDYDDHGVDPEYSIGEISPHHMAVVSRFAPRKFKGKDLSKLWLRAVPPDRGTLTFTGTGVGRENTRHILTRAAANIVGSGRDGRAGVSEYDAILSTHGNTGNPIGRPKKVVPDERPAVAQRRKIWGAFTKPDSVRDYYWSLTERWFVWDLTFPEVAAWAIGGQRASKSQVDRIKKAIQRAVKAARLQI